MKTAVSEGVRITVNTLFRSDLSRTELGLYFFNYRIEIVNINSFKIQLMHRDWYIFDSLNEANFVSGEGVVGEQPVLLPGAQFCYTSGVELSSEIGSMKGFYTFLNSGSETHFQANIPTFQLIAPSRLN